MKLEWECPKCGLVHITLSDYDLAITEFTNFKCPICGTPKPSIEKTKGKS